MRLFLDHFAFADPLLLLLLLLVPPLLFLTYKAGSNSSLGFSSLAILSSVGRTPREFPGGVALWLFGLALVAAILGLARPQWRTSFVARNPSGIDIVIALDVSKSMDIADFAPLDGGRRRLRRIEVAKDVVEEFIRERPDDRIGMVVFGARPYSLSPITMNHEWVIENLHDFQIGDIDGRGTAIGSAIAASTTRLTKRDSKAKIVVLVTDGASNSGRLDPIQAAEMSAELGIRIYTIGMGTEEGRLDRRFMPVPRQEFDPETLRAIAELTNGEFFLAETTNKLRDTFQSINELEKSEADTRSVVDAQELYQWFAGFAALLAFGAIGFRAFNPPPVP